MYVFIYINFGWLIVELVSSFSKFCSFVFGDDQGTLLLKLMKSSANLLIRLVLSKVLADLKETVQILDPLLISQTWSLPNGRILRWAHSIEITVFCLLSLVLNCWLIGLSTGQGHWTLEVQLYLVISLETNSIWYV